MVTLRTSLESSQLWDDAVRAVSREIVQLSPGDTDCRTILVDVDARGATVTFATRDERIAERRIAGPSELLPLVRALLVTGEEEPRIETVSIKPTLDVRDEVVEDRDNGYVAPRPADRGAALLALGGGLTAGAGEIGPIGQLELGLLRGDWELGLVGQLEPDHEGERTTVHVDTSAFGASALFAQRVPVGPAFVVAGAEMGLFSASEETRKVAGEAHGLHADVLEPRAGAILALIGPTLGRFRLRTQLEGQYALVSNTPDDVALPTFPRLTLALTFGAETSFLP